MVFSGLYEFLASSNVKFKHIIPLAPDASLRLYYRVINNNQEKLILCYTPPDNCDLNTYIKISNYLSSINVSVPNIFAYDRNKGYMLLEDFGNMSMKAHLLISESDVLSAEYRSMLDLLLDIQTSKLPTNIKFYDKETFLKHAKYYLDWYIIPYKSKLSDSKYMEWLNVWENLLSSVDIIPRSFVHRDFHVDNIMMLYDRLGLRRFGVIDFQDGILGPSLYDVVSLLQDPRFLLDFYLMEDLLEYFLNKSVGLRLYKRYFYIIGLHRALWIKAIFMKKKIQYNDTRYDHYIPAINSIIEYNISKFELCLSVKQLLDEYEN